MSTIEIKDKSALRPGDVATIIHANRTRMGEVTGTVYEEFGRLAVGGFLLDPETITLVRATREVVTEVTLQSIYGSNRVLEIRDDRDEGAIAIIIADTETSLYKSATVSKTDFVQALRDLGVIE